MDLLYKSLENLFHTNIKNISMNLCSKGDVNSSYIAGYKDQKYFIKIQNKNNLPQLYENQIEREIIGTSLCEKEGIPCPRVFDYNLEEKFIITEFMDHKLLGDLWRFFDDEERKDIKKQALRMLEKMNHIKSDSFGGIYKNGRIGQFSLWTDSYKNIVETALSDCCHYGSITEIECEAIRDKVNENCKNLNQKKQTPAVFAHLDLHWNNIFIDKSTRQIKGIFDFVSSLFTPEYMGYFRLNGGFLYGTDCFYDQEIICPLQTDNHEYQCAKILNTLDYFTFLSFKNLDYEKEKQMLLR